MDKQNDSTLSGRMIKSVPEPPKVPLEIQDVFSKLFYLPHLSIEGQ